MEKQDIINFCSKLSINKIGFVKLRKFNELTSFFEERKTLNCENPFEECDIEKRINPRSYMEKGKTIITIAFPYLYGDKYTDNGFSVYTRGNDYHRVVNGFLDKICEYIKSNGYEAINFVDSNYLPERYIAYLGGLGFIGKNNMLITKEYGSYVFLGEIITDLEIDVYDDLNKNFNEISLFNQCGECNLCYKNCPTKAINNNMKNSNICLSYITQNKDIDIKSAKFLNGRIFGCDTCQNICPKNKEITYSKLEEFKPFNFMNSTDYGAIFNISKGEFNSTLKRTSCGWRGKNVIDRNILIRKYLHLGEDISAFKFNSQYLKDFREKLIEKEK